VRVGLRQGRRRPHYSGAQDHGPADVAARPEDDVRSPAAQDPDAGGRGERGTSEGPREPPADLPGEALDAEGVELEPLLGGQSGLDRVRTPCERDRRAARAERFCDCERRQDVPGGSAGGDQAP
jgi:hypothetical protein